MTWRSFCQPAMANKRTLMAPIWGVPSVRSTSSKPGRPPAYSWLG